MHNGEEIRAWIDSSAKLIAALVAAVGVLVASIIGARYESRLTSVNLLSQREDSESRIRSSMFQTLVEPITRLSEGDRLDPARYRVLVEILTLNFHDQVEVKPLLLDLDRILSETGDQLGRRSIRSIARRVIDRQITALSGTSHAVHGKPAKTDDFYFRWADSEDEPSEDETSTQPCEGGTYENPTQLSTVSVCSKSPDGRYFLEILLKEPQIDLGTVGVNLTICSKQPPCIEKKDIVRSFPFTLTHFDFPLTDNSQIDPEHRFAISLYTMKKDQPIAIKVVWFPRDS